MCGRFYIDEQTKVIVGIQDEQTDKSPNQDIAVIIAHQGKLVSTKMKWGYTHPLIPQKIINAKSETLLKKKLFHDDAMYHRCVIVAKGFYEWDQAHHQISFESKQGQPLFMAGIYHGKEVVIITTKANDVMKPIHNRMPLFIKKDDVKAWLNDTALLETFLQTKTDDIKIVLGNVQQSLFDEM